MPESIIDLRSDTLTQPTAEMREAMAEAELGDDVYGEDPTVNRLEELIADMLSKEAAVYVPSGSMANQIGLRLHCDPGDEFLCEADSHIFNYEQAAYAQLFGLAAQAIQGVHGRLSVEHLREQIRPIDNHHPRTRLVCLENTHNRGAGRIQDYGNLTKICQWATEQGLARHLDGARLFNAVVATGILAADWAQHFDTVSVCFSKGLGAPVGSVLCGTHEKIETARRFRKALGGAMRQAGVLAAGALYALEHHIDRLVEDHNKAQVLASAIHKIPGLLLDPEKVDTNIVCFKISPGLTSSQDGDAQEFCKLLEVTGLLMNPIDLHRVRAVTHLDVTMEQILRACQIIEHVAGELDQANISAF